MPHTFGALRRFSSSRRYLAGIALFLAGASLAPLLPADLGHLLLLCITALAFFYCGPGPGWLTVLLVAAAGLAARWAPAGLPLAPAWLGASILSGLALTRAQTTLGALHESQSRLLAQNAASAREAQGLRSILDQQTEIISRQRADGTVLYVNEAYCRMFGVNAHDLIGAPAPPTTHEDDCDRVQRKLAGLTPEHPVVSVENRVRTATRGPRWCHFVHRAWFTADGRLSEIQSVGRDASERRQVEELLGESEERFRSFFEKNSCVLLMIDRASRRIVDANQAAARFYGYRLDTLIGMPVSRLNTLDEHALGEELARAEREGRTRFLFTHRLASGALRQVETYSTRLLYQGRSYQLSIVHDITEREQLQQRLVASEAEVQDLFNNAPCGYHSLGPDGTYSRINDTELAWMGRRREELIGKLTPLDIYSGESQRKFRDAYAQFRRTGRLQNEVFELVSTSGERRMVSVDASAITDGNGAIVASRTVLYDVTRLETVKRELERLSSEQHAMLDNELVGIAKLRGRQAIWLNRAMHRIFGYDEGEMIGKSTRAFYPSDEAYAAVSNAAYQVLKGGANYRAQVQLLRKDGQPIWIDMSGAPLRSGAGETIWLLADISALKQNEQHLRQLASIDTLTGVLSKGTLNDRLGQAIARARRRRALLAVLYVDLDAFKQINDTLGHPAGDQVLKAVAERLNESVRRSDCVVRVGGDEFVVVVEELATVADAEQVAAKIIAALGAPIALTAGQGAHIGASVGISIFPDSAQEIDTLLGQADQAMYRSKLDGKNRYTLFCDERITPAASGWIDLAPALLTGVEAIDRQHARLAHRANDLNNAVKAARPALELARLFDDLVQYAADHFADEESLMMRHAYPELARHRTIHAELLAQIADIRARMASGAELVALQALKDWFIHHVQTADRALGQYIRRSATPDIASFFADDGDTATRH